MIAVTSVVIAISCVASVLAILGIVVIAVCIVHFKQKVTSKSLYKQAY